MNRFLKSLFNHFGYKLVSIILAFFFWFLIQGEEILEINRKIQIHIHPPKGYMIKGQTTRYKDATLSGSRALLSDFSSGPIQAKISLPKGHVGKMKFRIDKEHIPDWNNKIKLTVHDAYLVIYIDEQSTKDIPLKEHIIGLPEEGYTLEKVSILPSKVFVTGLKSEIRKLKYVQTEPIDITSWKKSESLDAALTLPSEMSPMTELSADMVKVHIQIGEKKINKRFNHIPLEVETSLTGKVMPNFVRIELQGSSEILQKIEPGELRAFIDARELPVGNHTKKIQVKIPPDTSLIEIFPDKATVEVLR